VQNNPVNYTDPDGKNPFFVFAAAKGVALGVSYVGYKAAYWLADITSGGEVSRNPAIDQGAIRAFSIVAAQGGGAVAAYGGLAGAAAVNSYVLFHPETIPKAMDFLQGALPGPPPPSWAGYIGGITGQVIEAATNSRNRDSREKERCP
jgi:hypothetical protein